MVGAPHEGTGSASRCDCNFLARILVADDHPIVRDGILRLIEQQDDLMCCGEASSVAETQAAVARHKPDLVLLDLRLKNGDGFELIKCRKGAARGAADFGSFAV